MGEVEIAGACRSRAGGNPGGLQKLNAHAVARQANQIQKNNIPYYVYLLASHRNGTLYAGVTNDLVRRTWEHKQDFAKGFTSKYGVHQLVWYEAHAPIKAAITREKQIKKWNRDWKLRMIEEMNPDWVDLYAGFTA